MKLKNILILLLLFHSFLFADYKQILIAKTYQQKKLLEAQKKLSQLHIQTFIKRFHKAFLIYSKKYHNDKKLLVDFVKIAKLYPDAKVIRFNTSKKKSQQRKKKKKSLPILSKKDPEIFLSIASNSNTIGARTNNILAKNIDNNSFGYTLGGGYVLNDTFYFSINYLNAFTDDILLDNLFLGANYIYTITPKIKCYGGVLGGMSLLRLQHFATNSSSTSKLIGGEIGVFYQIMKKVTLFGSFQESFINHHIVFATNSTIDFNNISTFQLGVKYPF